MKNQYKIKNILFLFFSLACFSVSYGQDCNNCFDDGPLGCGVQGYYDGDGDGYGAGGLQCLYGNSPVARRGGDCNDNNASIRPRTFYVDADRDGYGTGSGVTLCQGPSAPTGYSTNNKDCDDNSASITVLKNWYADKDDDGFGLSSTQVYKCTVPGNMINPVNIGGDIDDNNSTITNIPPSTFYYDGDRDTYGTNSNTEYRSHPSSSFYITRGGDCNDNNPALNPATVWYLDTDNDGVGVSGSSNKTQCSEPTTANYALINGDLCPNEAGAPTNNGCPPDDTTVEPYNTVLTITYNVNGEGTSKTKSYADNLGRPIQTQSLDISTNKVWANQTLYDDQGRAILQTLSSPVNTNGHIFYKEDFFLKTDGSSYNTSDFENNPDTPPIVGNQSNTLGWYYSEANTSEAYQDITDYPFSGIVYSTLNPGTVLRTVGGTKINETWPQSYAFSVPASQELSQNSAFDDIKYETIKTIKTISRDVHGAENVVFTDTDGKVLALARSGGTTTRTMTIPISEQGFIDVHVPTGNNMGFSITTPSGVSVIIHNLISETIASASSSMSSGFYRVSINDLENYNAQANPAIITYKENYYDYSLNEYDKTGRLISSKQPLNHLESTFEYNTLGQLIYSTSPDEGEAWFKYRNDGQIRFSQNSKQKAVNEFSYTNYDNFGRPIESGVISNAGFTTIDPDRILPSGTKKEQQLTMYDVPDYNGLGTVLNTLVSEYQQNFLSGGISKTYAPGSLTTTTWYSYDIYGRVEWMVQKIEGLDAKTIDYEYDPITGDVTKMYFQKHKDSERFIHRYTYDPQDNSLIKVETSTDDINYTTHADYTYYETGSLKRMKLGGGIQGVDYVYNLVGQLKSINHPSLSATNDPGGDANDLFGMAIDYHQSDYMRSLDNIKSTTYGTDQLNGNIKGIRWNNGYQPLPNAQNTYSYQYNRDNWLTNAYYGAYNAPSNSNVPIDITKNTEVSGTQNYEASNSIRFLPGFSATSGAVIKGKIIDADGLQENNNGDYNVTGITYDANGNIQTLNRNKNTEGGSNAMDALSYTYKTDKPNQLLRVDDTVTATTNADDIKDQDGNNYVYDEIGQLIQNNEEGITYSYNARGLVTEVKKNNMPLVKFFYNDRNHRIKKENYNTSGVLQNSTYYVRDAVGATLAVYNNNTIAEHTIYGTSQLGVYFRQSNTSVYQLTDHLGNVRAVVGNNGTITNAADYYPFGTVLPNKQLSDGNYRYAYQGQEKDSETGKEAFQLRLWDGRIGRWLTTDPYGEFSSPYLGMGNNPISLTDPTGGCTDGNCPDEKNGGNDIYYKHGKEIMRVENNKEGNRFYELTPNDKFTTGFEAVSIPNPIRNPSVLFANNKTGYVYSKRDLSIRFALLGLGRSNVVTSAMLRAEASGKFMPLHSKEYYRDYVARWETNSAFWFAIEEGYFSAPGAGGSNGGAFSRGSLAGYQKGLSQFTKSMRNIKRPGGGYSPAFKVNIRKASLTKTRWNQFQSSHKGQFKNPSAAYNRIFYGK
ncbi:RHS repeat-associated core domain-containing protein [uncultured Aquimarina sp.]|uniref:RHS repeat domain-containing protein n=1 Tax=uncultured Aquimarina sp. TaxID=575652 RepID=UPI00260C515B|nr:RHS repeat-associated core domain-containing protein [uncultured Aquimarina sp.]